MKKLLLLPLLASTALAQMPPFDTTLGGLLNWRVSTVGFSVLAPPAPKTNVVITADCPAMIYTSDSPAGPWTELGWATNSLTVPANKPQAFFSASPLVTLAWDDQHDAGIAGFKVYSIGTKTNCVDVGNVFQATILVPPNTKLHATCYDATGAESEPSNSIEWSPSRVTLKIK